MGLAGSQCYKTGLSARSTACSAMAWAEHWIREKANAALHPSQVETTLLRLNSVWPGEAPPLVDVIEEFPLGEAALLHLLSISSICASRLTQDPSILLWLRQTDVCLSYRDGAQMSHDLRAMAGESITAENFRALRLWKGREMVRIARVAGQDQADGAGANMHGDDGADRAQIEIARLRQDASVH